MRVVDICSRPVFVTTASQPLAAAARLLQQHRVGALVVIDSDTGVHRPIGILTDRDILKSQLARGADIHCLTVAEAMTGAPLTIRANAELTEAVRALSARGVRRAPVVDETGVLTGIVTLDDLLPKLAQQLNALAEITSTQAHIVQLRTQSG